MQRVSSGYTVIEVLIFLAVSGFIFLTTIIFLSGRESENRFSQSMRDIQSKVQDWINDVPTGFAGTTSGINLNDTYCRIDGASNKLQIKNNGQPPTSPDCIFLGKAIQFTDQDYNVDPTQASHIFVYTVFGRRTVADPLSGDDRTVSNLVEATPTPVVGLPAFNNGQVDLTEDYLIHGSAKVKKIIKSSGIAGDNSHLAGFYLSFNPTSVKSNGSSDLKAYQYPINDNHEPGNVGGGGNDIDECIFMNDAGAVDCSIPGGTSEDQWPPSLTNWQICFNNSAEDETALLTISSSNGLGVTTKLDFTPC